jgi:hypothetical protein
MAISNIDKKHLDKIFEEYNLEILNNNGIRQKIVSNSNSFSKLKVLFRQLELIKMEINEVVKETIETSELQKIKCNIKKIPGKIYYLYKNKNRELFFSILSHEEWDNYENYLGKYLYNFDYTLTKQD